MYFLPVYFKICIFLHYVILLLYCNLIQITIKTFLIVIIYDILLTYFYTIIYNIQYTKSARGVYMETMLGEIELFPFTFVPRGWLLCNGQLLSIAQNQALYSLLRNSYGGDGRTTFALPNLLGTEPIPNTKFYIAIQGFYPTQG